jgi:hypothetical protein
VTCFSWHGAKETECLLGIYTGVAPKQVLLIASYVIFPPALFSIPARAMQLKENIAAFTDVKLSPETLDAIEEVHVVHRNPQTKD